MTQGNHVNDPCALIQDDLKAYCDGELSWFRRRAVRRHLSGCAACGKEVHAMHMLHEGLRRGDGPEEAFAPALRQRILSQVADVPPLPAPRRPARLLQYGFVASFAANCLLLFLFTRNVSAPFPVMPDAGLPAVSGPASPPTAESRTKTQPQKTKASQTASHVRPLPHEFDPFTSSPVIIRADKHPVPQAATATVSSGTTHGTVPLKRKAQTAPPVAGMALPEKPNDTTEATAMKSSVAEIEQNAVPIEARGKNAPSHPAAAPQPMPQRLAKPSAADVASPPVVTPTVPFPPNSNTPSSPPASLALPAPATVPGPLSRSFGQAGFGGGGFGGAAPGGGSAAGVERETPVALNPWPAIALLSANVKHGLVAENVRADWQVDEQGHVSDVHFTTSGNAALDTALGDAIRHNHYLPALKDGKPVTARMSYLFVISP